MTIGEIADAASKAATFISVAATALFGWLMLRLRAEFATKKELLEVKQQSEQNGRDIAEVKLAMANMPTAADITALRLQIEELNGNIKSDAVALKGVKDALQRTDNAVTRVEQFLMRGGKK